MLSSEGPGDLQEPLFSGQNGSGGRKRKRWPAGTPDPEAEVVSLSPKTLLESDRYVCEICNQGFQRDQNLQMHRRRHKVPWKLMKREKNAAARKRVFVCPEPSCIHHDPCHALGDLVGIKKHFRRKHSNQKHWVCAKCFKAYAVQSDYKAHLKTCGTRGHSCDCGRVFSRVESFIEHQDTCNTGRHRPEKHPLPPPGCSPNPATEFICGVPAFPSTSLIPPPPVNPMLLNRTPNLELQLSIGAFDGDCSPAESSSSAAAWLKEQAEEQLRLAMKDRAYAEEIRWEARRQIELAEQELGSARRLRQQAMAELVKSQALKEEAAKQFNPFMLQNSCYSCQHKYPQTF